MNATWPRRLLRLLPWLLVLLLLALVLRRVSLAEAWAVLRQLGPLDLLLLALANGLVLLTLSGRWWLILRAPGYEIPYLRLAAYRLAAFGVTYFTPGPQFGGEPLQVYLPEKYEGLPRSTGVAAVALDKSLELLVNFAFLAGGVALMAQTSLLPGLAGRQALAAALALAALPLAFLAMIWAGWQPFSWPLAWVGRRLDGKSDRSACDEKPGFFVHARSVYEPKRDLSTRAAAAPTKTPVSCWPEESSEQPENPISATAGRWATYWRIAEGLRASEAQARDFCREHPDTLLLALAVSLLSWAGMVAEYWLALRLLGLEMTLSQAVVAMTAARIAYLAALPAGLGALEASQVLIMQALGANPAAGLSISVLMRTRDILLSGIGLWLAVRLLRRAGQSGAAGISAADLPSLATYATIARQGRMGRKI